MLQRLRGAADAQQARQAAPKLATLWELLIPEAERRQILDGKFDRLMVVPDGALTLLPFETLITSPSPLGGEVRSDEPVYLLDAGPAIQYAPSATILYNLAARTVDETRGRRSPVLTVGNPAYDAPGTDQVADADASPSGLLVARSRYGSLGGHLSRLPHSGTESSWVAQAFMKQNVGTGRLLKEQATEAAVRYNLAGRRIVHLACHGLADQAYGNQFGALALAPGKPGVVDPADDGFLTLAEIYGLDLKGSELAILSACDTNFGPQQRGEGVWSLTRGFLVAGSRRVVASNWLVDDEAAATLIYYFAHNVAEGEKDGDVDYARALHQAKRAVRKKEKWQSPYYWGTFVLVGPN